MATAVAQSAPFPDRSTTPPVSPLSLNTSVRGTPAAIPNKHLPICSPGPRPSNQTATPPASPESPCSVSEAALLLASPDKYQRLSTKPPVYSLTGSQLYEALDELSTRPLADPRLVFPWLHGLHADNQLQLAFFIGRRKVLRRDPRCIRSIALVKADGDLSHSKLKGAIGPEELLQAQKEGQENACFLDNDPKDGFSVRNFQIQAAKLATVSDVVVYGDDKTSREAVKRVAERISRAQRAWRDRDRDGDGVDKPTFHTYVLEDRFAAIEQRYPDIVAIRSDYSMAPDTMDFFLSERQEMHTMSAATEFAHNVWLGPTPDIALDMPLASNDPNDLPCIDYDILIEATDLAHLPDRRAFRVLENLLSLQKYPKTSVPQLEFPGSGSIMPPTWSQIEVDGLMNTCIWMYKQANEAQFDRQALAGADIPKKRKDSRVQMTPHLERDTDGDSIMGDDTGADVSDQQSAVGRKMLLHCTDGYTESTLLALAYYMYANCVPLHTAYIELHTIHQRNFFAYPTDVALLTAIQPRILQASPVCNGRSITELSPPMPAWMKQMDGSLPSRIMDYLYLGNLGHANNVGLLKELGIGQVLSVGEPVNWTDNDRKIWAAAGRSKENLLYIDKVQDNGVDPLTDDFPRCLEFIERGRKAGTRTLVHCRVGVSRSATICIAEVMNELGLSFPRAYCFVRARRLNVIIQPHLRFSYELLKYEEFQAKKRGVPFKRELEWATIAREIAAMNKPYSRQ